MITVNREMKMSILHESDPAIAFAAAEFKNLVCAATKADPRNIGIIPGNAPEIVEGYVLFLGKPAWCLKNAGVQVDESRFKYDGFHVSVGTDKTVVSSLFGRGILYGVYSLLEEIGYRWFYPGELGTIAPSFVSTQIADRVTYDNPDFEIRSFSEGSHKNPLDIWTVEAFELMDWMGKSKCNSMSFHGFLTEPPANWDMVKAECIKRNFIIEIGGHGVQDFVPKELFEERPELFRVKDGVRVKDGNFCASNQESVDFVAERIKKILRKFGDIDIIHLCFDDVVGGSWCSCDLCGQKDAISQMYSVVDGVWQRIKGEFPKTAVDMVLYHDTLDTDKIDMPVDKDIIGTLGLRERCYSHGLDEKSCGMNRFYLGKLEEIVRTFGDKAYVFDYYDDMILFLKMKVNSPKVIAEDLKCYRKLGINKITSLEFGRFSWWAYEFNMLAFAALTWNIDCDYRALLVEMCEKLYPSNSAGMIKYFDMVEEAAFKIFSFCGYNSDGKAIGNDIRNLLVEPMEFSEKHTADMVRANEIYKECEKLLESFAPAGSYMEEERVRYQKLMMTISIWQSRATYLDTLTRQQFAKGVRDLTLLNGWIDEAMAIEAKEEEWIKGIPFYIKGMSGGNSIYERMCNDNWRMYRRTRRIVNAG